ncbi:mediator of RNA polymerase II transcription subunit 24-like isoform X2 [Pomacea canaliculata]|uniref:mediator of RNA polymerase II transcription subunit 24-like isoform X2 n=1 Tax=Pomacea canaliculata TaxID=400727 RepID=UPI000D72FCB4|nr:mediator of RNA polymerase II transcription subunit 24-like isoform X2 [Pomacea canaliculata]
MAEIKREATNLTNRVKILLMQAWRERWSDVQWGIQLKRLFSVHSGESCDLAEILLQQTLVGSSPNSLLLSYLKHTVLSQIVPCSSVLNYIAAFDDLSRPYCVLALIHLAEVFGTKLSFSYGPDSSLQVCRSLLGVLHWLLLQLLKCLQTMREERPELIQVMDSASKAATGMLRRPTVTALLQVARADNTEAYREFEQSEVNLRGTLSQLPPGVIPDSTRESISTMLTLAEELPDVQVPLEPVLHAPHLPVCPTLNALVALEAVLNSNSDVQPFVDQILMLARLMKISRPLLFLEIFRACFMGLVDSTTSSEELKWATFTFLKMRQIMVKIQQLNPGPDFSSDVEKGIDMLLQYRHLLDQADIKHRWDCLSQFLKECMQFNILTENQMNLLKQKRQIQREQLRPGDLTTSTTSSVGLIARAETTVISILKTLDADHQKNQDPLVGVLSQMLSGRSFEIITSAAASMGELKNFTMKLIRTNEFARVGPADTSKTSQTRAQLFDITFLMLCHIIQLHGMEIVTGHKEASESFIVQWAQRWLPEDGKYRSLDTTAVPQDQSKVDSLLMQFMSGDPRTNVQRWHELCINTPFAVQEVLFAWEHKALAKEKVMAVMDSIKSRMSCLSVVTCVWLCSYMNVVGTDARQKPLAMLEHLTRVKIEQATSTESRSHLMHMVMERIMNDVLPGSHPQRTCAHMYVSTDVLPIVTLHKTLTDAFQRGWLGLSSIHTLEQLLALCGSDWFCEKVVMQMLEWNKAEELSQALSLVLAIFHMDLEHLTHSMLLRLMPRLLLSTVHTHMLTDPRGFTLAKLCVLCITGTQTSKIGQKEPYVRRSRKRSKIDAELEDIDDSDIRPGKVRKLHEPQLTLNLEGFNLDDISAKEDGESSPNFDSKDPMNKALINLFLLMNAIIHDPSLTPRTTFIISFIEEAIKCGAQYARFILQFMPPTMLPQLMKTMPGVFSNAQILQICDLTMLTGRKVAAKAISSNSRFMDKTASV